MIHIRQRIAFGLCATLILLGATAAQALTDSSTHDPTPQATIAATSSCARTTDYHNTCVCPAGSQVIVYGEVVATPANLWWGINQSHMYLSRLVGIYGINPTAFQSTGVKHHATGQTGPVYYGTGSGWQNQQWSWMGAYCQQAWRIADA